MEKQILHIVFLSDGICVCIFTFSLLIHQRRCANNVCAHLLFIVPIAWWLLFDKQYTSFILCASRARIHWSLCLFAVTSVTQTHWLSGKWRCTTINGWVKRCFLSWKTDLQVYGEGVKGCLIRCCHNNMLEYNDLRASDRCESKIHKF